MSMAFPEAPSYSARRTVRIIVAVIGILIVLMWAAVGFSIIASRRAALDDAHLEGRNLMIAFREEVAHTLQALEVEMTVLSERMRQEGAGFNLYAWGQDNALITSGVAQVAIVGPDGKGRANTLEPHSPPIDLNDRAHFRIHLDGQFHGLYIGQTVISRASGLPIIPISQRVEAADGTPFSASCSSCCRQAR
jgi:hypothetical protein